MHPFQTPLLSLIHRRLETSRNKRAGRAQCVRSGAVAGLARWAAGHCSCHVVRVWGIMPSPKLVSALVITAPNHRHYAHQGQSYHCGDASYTTIPLLRPFRGPVAMEPGIGIIDQARAKTCDMENARTGISRICRARCMMNPRTFRRRQELTDAELRRLLRHQFSEKYLNILSTL